MDLTLLTEIQRETDDSDAGRSERDVNENQDKRDLRKEFLDIIFFNFYNDLINFDVKKMMKYYVQNSH